MIEIVIEIESELKIEKNQLFPEIKNMLIRFNKIPKKSQNYNKVSNNYQQKKLIYLNQISPDTV